MHGMIHSAVLLYGAGENGEMDYWNRMIVLGV